MSTPVNEITYTRATLLGQDILLSETRIGKSTIPADLYCYDLRHSDSDWGAPSSIEPHVLVNWYGTILCRKPIDLNSNRMNPADQYKKVNYKSLTNKQPGVKFDEWYQPNQLHVVMVKPMEKPTEAWIGSELEDLQAAVGGYIQAVYPFHDDVALICNEEGKLKGLQPNRLLKDAKGEPYDVVCGTFFIVGNGEEDFKSLTDAQVKRYMDFYSKDMLVAIPPAPKKKKHKTQER
jgi:hypothetical protein